MSRPNRTHTCPYCGQTVSLRVYSVDGPLCLEPHQVVGGGVLCAGSNVSVSAGGREPKTTSRRPLPVGVVDLSVLRAAPVPGVVAELERLLERARAGEIRGLAVVASCEGGAHATSYELGDGSIGDLIVGCLRLQRRLLNVHGEDLA